MKSRNRNNIDRIKNRTFSLPVILVGCLVLTLTSCEDFLTPDPQSFSTTANYYQSPAHFEAAINSAYSRLRAQAGVQNDNFRHIVETRMDATNRHFDVNLPGVNQQPFLEWFAVNSNSIPRDQWNQIFHTITQTNIILSRVEDIEFEDQTQKDRIIGQAKFIRAFSYWFGVQFFGDLPAVTEEQTSPDLASSDKDRRPVEFIYNEIIIPDLQDAASKLPPSWPESGRATSGAANALLGKTYLITGEYGNAVSTLESLVGRYELLEDYLSVFDPSNTNHAESIFELQFGANVTGQPESGMVSKVLPWHLRGEIVDNIVNPDSDDNFFPSYELLEFYEDGDERFESTFLWTENEGNSQYVEIAHRGDSIAIIQKYLWPEYLDTSNGEQEGNIILLRYADVLLSLAEAHWRNGDNGALALPYVNEVRSRAGLPPVNLANVPQSPMLEGTHLANDALGRAIFNERTVELFAEGHRMFDLQRFGVTFDVLTNYADSRKSRESRIQGVFNIQEFEILLPIHPEEIAASDGAITQNPGW